MIVEMLILLDSFVYSLYLYSSSRRDDPSPGTRGNVFPVCTETLFGGYRGKIL